jgi:2-iminobutanoate/2-iminopropanoate deaminase
MQRAPPERRRAGSNASEPERPAAKQQARGTMSDPAKPVGPYTPIVRAGDWLVVSGQVGLTDGRLVAGGVAGELRQAIANLEAHLATEGATLADVVKTTVFLRHMSDYTVMNETYVAAFGDHRPARSAIGVAELPIGALVEVEAWAWLGG